MDCKYSLTAIEERVAPGMRENIMYLSLCAKNEFMFTIYFVLFIIRRCVHISRVFSIFTV